MRRRRHPLLTDSHQTLWLVPHSNSLTPLLSAIHTRKLVSFTHGCLSLLLHSAVSATDVQLMSRLIDSRVMPEVEIIKMAQVKANVVRNVLQILTFHDNEDVVQRAASLVTDWYRQNTEWKKAVEETLKTIVSFLNLCTFSFTSRRSCRTNGVQFSRF